MVEPVKAEGKSKKTSLENSSNWYKAESQASSIGNSLVLKRSGLKIVLYQENRALKCYSTLNLDDKSPVS